MNVLIFFQVAEILKDRPSWHRECRRFDVRSVIPTGNGGIVELIYIQVCLVRSAGSTLINLRPPPEV